MKTELLTLLTKPILSLTVPGRVALGLSLLAVFSGSNVIMILAFIIWVSHLLVNKSREDVSYLAALCFLLVAAVFESVNSSSIANRAALNSYLYLLLGLVLSFISVIKQK